MAMTRVTATASLSALVVFGLLATPAADACTCSASPNNCSAAATADAVVFEATVESTELVPPTPPPDQAKLLAGSLSASEGLFLGRVRKVTLRDLKSWRGEPQITILTAALTESCGYDFSPGLRYLIVATRLEDGRLMVTRCGLTRPVSEDPGLLGYVQTLGQVSARTRVWGQVRMPFGSEPDFVSGARVTVKGPVERSTVAAADGRYVFPNLPYGEYSMSIDAPRTLRQISHFLPETFPSDVVVVLEKSAAPACAELNFRAAPF